MALSSKQHKILPLQMEKNGLRQAEKLKNQKSSLRAGKGKKTSCYIRRCFMAADGRHSWPNGGEFRTLENDLAGT